MTKEQFAVWLQGYLHISFRMDRTTTAIEIDVQKMGDDVLEAARSVIDKGDPSNG